MKMVSEEQAGRLAEAYFNYASIRVSEIEYTLDVELALSACRSLRKIQEELDISMTGLNRDGDDKLIRREAILAAMLQQMRADRA